MWYFFLEHDKVKQNLQNTIYTANISVKPLQHLGKCINYFPTLNKLLIN